MNTHKSYLHYIRIIRASGIIAFILKGFESTSGVVQSARKGPDRAGLQPDCLGPLGSFAFRNTLN